MNKPLIEAFALALVSRKETTEGLRKRGYGFLLDDAKSKVGGIIEDLGNAGWASSEDIGSERP